MREPHAFSTGLAAIDALRNRSNSNGTASGICIRSWLWSSEMNEEIRTLVESLRRGQYEDPTAKIELLSAALLEYGADDALLLSLLRAPQISLRLAAVAACRGRLTGEVVGEFLKLAQDQEPRVRRKVAEILD